MRPKKTEAERHHARILASIKREERRKERHVYKVYPERKHHLHRSRVRFDTYRDDEVRS